METTDKIINIFSHKERKVGDIIPGKVVKDYGASGEYGETGS